ncbi:MAG TPA: DUF3090 family protein [Egibacteraceae bacterium]
MAELEFDPVDWITAGAIGEPGRRTFYVQARRGDEFVAIVVEKGQVAGIARLAQELLARVGVTVTPDDLDEKAQRVVDPVVSAWRGGSMNLGMDAEGDRFVLEIEALDSDDEPDLLDDQPTVARFWMSREQVVKLAAYAAYAVQAGARERCRLCGRPIDPVDGHVCPAMNGHGPLTA